MTIQQDRAPNGTLDTGFTGQEIVDAGTPAVQLYQFAGTVDSGGNSVRIGVSDQGFLIEGGKVESDQLTAYSVRTVAGHANDGLVILATHYD